MESSSWFPTSISTTPGERPWLILGALLGLFLIVGVALGKLTMTWTEVFGFISGALCVYFTVKRHIWNFPVGIVNNIFFGFLFYEARLFADMSLQVVYLVLGVLGWLWWTRGEGNGQDDLQVRRASSSTLVVLLILTLLGTWAMYLHLVAVKDAAPLWDALTTALSLAAQYLLSRKWIENWWFWIAADLIYVPLYIERGLYLTAALYALFLALCVVGWREWRRSLHTQPVT